MPGPKRKVGAEAGHLNEYDKRVIGIDGRQHYSLRLAVLYQTGRWPEPTTRGKSEPQPEPKPQPKPKPTPAQQKRIKNIPEITIDEKDDLVAKFLQRGGQVTVLPPSLSFDEEIPEPIPYAGQHRIAGPGAPPWWYHAETGQEARSKTCPGWGWLKGRLPMPKQQVA
jgi:hypothetical protein